MMTYITILYNVCTLGPLLGLGLSLGLCGGTDTRSTHSLNGGVRGVLLKTTSQ